RIARRDARMILAFAIAVPVVSLLVSPSVAIVIHRVRSVEPHALHGHSLARRVDAVWAAASSHPLRFVDGEADLAYEIAAYAHDKPRALSGMPPVNPEAIARRGKVVVCYVDGYCAQSVSTDASREPTRRLIEMTLTRN